MEKTEECLKTPMTDEERLLLAERLDKDLDDYISSLEKKSYTEGWPEDKWQEEFEKHPFFMTKSPEEGEELSPLMEGIQQLKYDSTENTPEELAETYKEDGNFNFKCKKYRLAILAYTEGLKQKCSDDDINAKLYNNRASANFSLKNYRTCLMDCLLALKLKPDYQKAQFRAAVCYHILKKYDEALVFCDNLLKSDPNNESLKNLKIDSLNKKKIADRDKRRGDILEKKVKADEEKLIKAIQERKIKFCGKEDGITSVTELEPVCTEVIHRPVHIENDRLVWPVIFLYPEYKTTDFIQEFHEDSKFQDQLHAMFKEPPVWDTENKYVPDKLGVYYEDLDNEVHSVSLDSTLGEVLSDKRYYVDCGTPSFFIIVIGTENLYFKK